MNNTIRYRIYDDDGGITWAAESESQLRDYDNGDAEWGYVSWPVRELSEFEIDARTIDITQPDVEQNGPRDIISMREFLFKNINELTGVQVVCVREIWDTPKEPDAPFCGCGD